jgi:hypothetical protein
MMAAQPDGESYYGGMQWRGIILGPADAEHLNQYDRDIAKAQSPGARSWLLQNKAEYMALLLNVTMVSIG